MPTEAHAAKPLMPKSFECDDEMNRVSEAREEMRKITAAKVCVYTLLLCLVSWPVILFVSGTVNRSSSNRDESHNAMSELSKRFAWWQGGLAGIGAAIFAWGHSGFYSTGCSNAILVSLTATAATAGAAAPFAELTIGGCIAAAGLALAGAFLTGSSIAGGWNFQSGSTSTRSLSDSAYSQWHYNEIESAFADSGMSLNYSLTEDYYSSGSWHWQSNNIQGRFVVSIPLLPGSKSGNSTHTHYVFTNHTSHLSVAFVTDDDLDEVLYYDHTSANVTKRETCGLTPCVGSDTGGSWYNGIATWVSYNSYGYNGDYVWDRNGIIQEAMDLAAPGSAIAATLDSESGGWISKACVAASAEGSAPGQNSIVVGEAYFNQFGGIDSQCQSF